MSEETHTGVARTPGKGRAPHGFAVYDDVNLPAEIDWSRWYLDEENAVPASMQQWLIIQLFVACLESWVKERGWRCTVGAEVLFNWIPEDHNVRVAPDAFVCDTETFPMKGVVRTWKPGCPPPRFVLEVVSSDRKKDYELAPEKYASLGSRELVVFDPETASGRPGEWKHALTVFQRLSDGGLHPVYKGSGPAFSKELDAWLVIVDDAGTLRLRLARDADGQNLVPTASERSETARAKAEAEQARAEANFQEAQRKIQELEAKLDAPNRGS